jgi:hypothetical protein
VLLLKQLLRQTQKAASNGFAPLGAVFIIKTSPLPFCCSSVGGREKTCLSIYSLLESSVSLTGCFATKSAVQMEHPRSPVPQTVLCVFIFGVGGMESCGSLALHEQRVDDARENEAGGRTRSDVVQLESLSHTHTHAFVKRLPLALPDTKG